jgi:hypothetical protein
MQYIEKVYLDKISPYLKNFEQKSDTLWNCSCPFCGDSKTNKRKARGYFFEGDDGNLLFTCHNCQNSVPLTKVIKDLYPQYYTQYCLDTFSKKESKLQIKAKPKQGEIKLAQILDNIKNTPKNYKSILELHNTHEAKSYLINRKILNLSEFGYVDKFSDYVAEVTNNASQYALLPNDKRIIIPLMNPNGVMVGFQGRAIDPKSMRYITIKIPKYEEEYCKIFGLNRFDKSKFGFMVEGPFDASFLPNCLAFCGTSLDQNVIKRKLINPDNMIIVIDNEARNKQIVARMEQYVDMGFRVYIPPNTINSVDKDINKMILSGWTSKQLIELFVKNSYKSISAKLKIANWKKC